jgi:hypothetical protein
LNFGRDGGVVRVVRAAALDELHQHRRDIDVIDTRAVRALTNDRNVRGYSNTVDCDGLSTSPCVNVNRCVPISLNGEVPAGAHRGAPGLRG